MFWSGSRIGATCSTRWPAKQASLSTFCHLDKIEPALQKHLESFATPMTSSHKDYEKTVPAFTEAKFPGRFGSYREYQSASAFRKRMLDYGLWSEFITYCNHNMDFQVAGEMDPNVLYKICNVASRKFLAYAPGLRTFQFKMRKVKA